MPRHLRLLLCVALLGLTAGRADAANPFGIMLWPPNGRDLPLAATRAAGLGVAWFRPPAVTVNRWQVGMACPDCQAVARSGLQLALTVRSDGGTAPPADLKTYGKTLAAILDAWRPQLLVLENEENATLFPSDPPTPQARRDIAAAYGRQLEVACTLAHARGILCTNGGLSTDAAISLTWVSLLEAGKPELACDFARRANRPPAGDQFCAYRKAGDVPPDLRERLLANADLLLPIYRQAPLDAVNFHWYGHDATVLAETAEVLRQASGKPVLSNEIGERRWEADPATIRPVLRAAFAAGLKVAIWFSIDTPQSMSLLDENGILRPAGREFARQMSGQR